MSATGRPAAAGRNDPCPCGSGRKYKKCCLEKDQEQARAAARRPSPPRTLGGSPMQRPESTPQEQARDALLAGFEALEHPGEAQAEGLIEGLRTLPPDVVDWGAVLKVIAVRPQLDLAAAYRRLLPLVPHGPGHAAAIFYWMAAHQFSVRGRRDLLPQVAEGFRRLGPDSWDPVPLRIVQDYLIEARQDTAALQLAEHFLPLVRAHASSAVSWRPLIVQCARILHLRAGQLLRQGPEALSREDIGRHLWRDFTVEDVEPRLVKRMADALWQPDLQTLWRRQDFQLCAGRQDGDEEDLAQVRHVNAALIQVAREAWEHEQFPPGAALRAVHEVLDISCDARAQRTAGRRGSRRGDNLLDYLAVDGMEGRIVSNCSEKPGALNLPLLRLTIEGHELLLRFSQRHALLPSREAAAPAAELARLCAQTDLRLQQEDMRPVSAAAAVQRPAGG
jgi:hypothetical protein